MGARAATAPYTALIGFEGAATVEAHMMPPDSTPRSRISRPNRALRRTGGVLVLAIALLVVARSCDQAPASAGQPVEWDSAGVRIVEYDGAPAPTGSFAVERLYEHGHAPGDYEFQLPMRAALRPDGSVLVGDMGNQEVVDIASDGSGHALLAVSGQGPEEVSRILSVHVRGSDTVWVEDDGNAKLMRFVAGAPTVTVSMAGDFALTTGLVALGIDRSGGRFLMSTSAYRPGFEQPWLEGHLVRFDPGSRRADTAATYDLAPRSRDTGVNPFSSSGVVAETGGDFVHARRDVPELVWRGVDGSVRQIVRRNPDPSYPTGSDWETFEADLRVDLRRVNPQVSRDDVAAFLDEVLGRYEVYPDEPLPLFGRIHGDDGGAVWMAHFVPSSSPRATGYDVVSPTGAWMGTVAFPMPFLVMDVRGDLVVGAFTDDLDVQAIAVYRISYRADSR
jgi:hypothetical protein